VAIERIQRSALLAPGEPAARWVIFAGFRTAASDIWGPSGLKAIGAGMPDEVRKETVDAAILSAEMLPERYVMAWYEAVWAGPANGDRAAFCTFLYRMMDHGFGRVRKALLGLVSPSQLAEKAPDLWRHDHDTGTLTVSTVNGGGIFVLRDHVYLQTPLSRLALAEIYRYALSLARGVHTPTQSHGLDRDGSLRVRVTWALG
jgi:hypothetical protein